MVLPKMVSVRPLLLILAVLPVFSIAEDGSTEDGRTGCPMVFKGRCKCGPTRYAYWKPDKDVYVVNCTNTGFTDTTMLELLPPNTEVLIFTGNNIPILEWNLFGIWDDHNSLEVVDLTNNRINEIAGKSFHKVKNVKRLVLNHNNLMISGTKNHRRIFTNFYNLEELHLTNTFTETIDSKWYLKDLKQILLASNMTKLIKLHLEQNEIWKIEDEEMFCGLPALRDLYLGDNQLEEVNFSLNCLKQLRYLDLEYNKIRRLSNATLKKFDEAFSRSPDTKLNLKENPFRCDCGIRNFYDWLLSTKTQLFHKEDLRCYDGYPETNAGHRIINVKELPCTPDSSTGNPSAADSVPHSVTHALLVVLILLVAALLIVIIYINRIRLRENIKPLVENIQRSMQYRTIEKDEEIPEVNV